MTELIHFFLFLLIEFVLSMTIASILVRVYTRNIGGFHKLAVFTLGPVIILLISHFLLWLKVADLDFKYRDYEHAVMGHRQAGDMVERLKQYLETHTHRYSDGKAIFYDVR